MKFFIMLFFLAISEPTMSQSNNSAKIISLTAKEYQSINVAANYFATKKNPMNSTYKYKLKINS